jgi:uncharacterized protein YndB with AHSA1/START domain
MSTDPVLVRVTRQIPASSEQVFDAWLDPAWIERFMFGPELRDEEIVRLSLDPRVGGKFSFVVRRQGTEIDHVGTYHEIDRPRRLAFTWGVAGQSTDESVVTIDITPQESGCELTLTHPMDPKWADYAERVQGSWAKMVESLAKNI